MASKGSYFQKHKEQIHGKEFKSLPVLRITEEMREPFAAGQVLLLDKPLHWTSFDVVRKIRNSIGIKKVGHAGTLDPLATGLLIICTGKATKTINDHMAREKTYTGTITLGAVTPTYDLESLPGQQKDISNITREDIETSILLFTGSIMQVPPIYSAIKKDGEAMYQLARRGEEIELQPRPVTIHVFDLVSYEAPVLHFKVVCSTGTYIRSLAHDLGAALGCGAFLSSLRRTHIGPLNVEDAFTPAQFLHNLEEQMAKKDS